MKIALVGITGYAGMQLYQLLQNHPNVTQINIYQHDLSQKTPLWQVNNRLDHQHLAMALPYDSQQIMADNDVLFLATSAGIATQLAQPFLDQDFPVIDLSGDFRLKEPETYQKWYHKTGPTSQNLAHSYYGLADLNQNHQQHYIANPGCYATATLLGLAPLVQADLIYPDSIIVDAKSGLSGAGKSLSTSSHYLRANENMQVYKANQHQHIPEILAQLQAWNPTIPHLQFMTSLIPIDRGIMASIYTKVKPGIGQADIQQAYQKQYQAAPFINLLDEDLPDIKSVVGSNNCNIGLAFNEKTGYLLTVSVIDNMLKGAAGQAIQNMNQFFHLNDTSGLPLHPNTF
ncbi:N-acetyl-gamma-glutamyl-phosphate reductase [Convivina intestini]|uniref:N-acetyl-gamma-glutamyl-phosphate reductase n=1 Tax=Convivina intestini TaxID=1505726 RepID=A0A2U1DFL7_9LACO|nr:N-acetyl-gamma-glutamyl-phosphate reductase [Convivina intestini]PVY86369.1 N-acetyl-gamma-glutamyl-phosphate reductase [Convivina intestini]CAH1850628.1 N-acetyl-gamma-glutamyl-phosphate reductase [Convivina intestini]SDB82991.1 N-acetyl-gamma-glutamyl-phosphate reductase [Leuconostocaceae bacterium R-53105]